MDIMRSMTPPFRIVFPFVLMMVLILTACTNEGEVITKPDEYSRAFESNEKVVLRAVEQVFKDKGFGASSVNRDKKEIESTYLIQNGWRSKTIARVKKINWKETEVTLSVITEKQMESKWEMRRLLQKEQYDSIFDAIELQIYQEMYKTD
jgi:hypothetical protein